jgi:group I intron endonuclease
MTDGVIYCITNTVNGHRYIGQTLKGVRTRWRNHKSEANRNSQYAIHRAMRKYGYENFKMEVIAIVFGYALQDNPDLLDDLEKFFIIQYKTRTRDGRGYNAAPGGNTTGRGEDSPNYGRRHSKEFRERQSVNKLGSKNPNFGKHANANQRAAASRIFRGKKLSESHRAKIAASRMTENPSAKALIKRAWRAKVRANGGILCRKLRS